MTANSYNMSRFTGKAALVTGGASGIGRATAQRLAAEGAHVFIVDLNPELGEETVAGIEQAGGRATFIEADLTDDAAVRAAANAVAKQAQALHILVNNAAIVRQGLIEDGGWQENWEIETRLGIRSWLLITQLLLPLLKVMPPIYGWRMRARVYRWYRDLERVDERLGADPDAATRAAALAELDQIEREVRRVDVPLSFAGQLYHLRQHIELVRQRLTGR